MTGEDFVKLSNTPNIPSQVSKPFTKLKKVSLAGVINTKEVIRNLVRSCDNIQEISLNGYLTKEFSETLKCTAETLRERNHIGTPLLLNLIFFKVRLWPFRSEINRTTKLLFQVSYGIKEFSPDFITYDLNAFVEEVTLLMKNRSNS